MADVLARYDQGGRNDAPVFSAVLDGIRAFDADEPSDELVAEVLARVDESVRASGALNSLKGQGIANLIGVLSCVIALVGIPIALKSLEISRESLAVSRESAKSAREGATSEDIAALLRVHQERTKKEVEADRSIRYLHGRTLLRSGPNGNERTMRIVYPDQLVRVLETKRDWVRVEVYDYGNEMPIVGWISRSLLRVRPAR
ncbi:SH3 domain-containing protein [Bradyrhizobium sp. B124]|uniref:SH3 domain-containing protein n=1 Tax=Bradyrhizobium sp. B124 TaxID=3140245 RepID=UPI00318405C1